MYSENRYKDDQLKLLYYNVSVIRNTKETQSLPTQTFGFRSPMLQPQSFYDERVNYEIWHLFDYRFFQWLHFKSTH